MSTTRTLLQERWPVLTATPPALGWLAMRADLRVHFESLFQRASRRSRSTLEAA